MHPSLVSWLVHWCLPGCSSWCTVARVHFRHNELWNTVNSSPRRMALQILLKMLNAHSPIIMLHALLGAELPECTSSQQLASLSQCGFPTAKIFRKNRFSRYLHLWHLRNLWNRVWGPCPDKHNNMGLINEVTFWSENIHRWRGFTLKCLNHLEL